MRHCGSIEQGNAIKVITRFNGVCLDPGGWRSARDDRDCGNRRYIEYGTRGGKGVVQAVACVQIVGSGLVTFSDGV